jgi:UDP-glucose 4-epimerase
MRLAGTKIFVTGGAGFIGSHIVSDLLTSGASVTVYDNFSTGLDENLSDVRDSIELIRGDILDAESLLASMRGHDAVSHQAAQLEITRAIDTHAFDLTTNGVGTLNVLQAAAELGITKIVEASSAGVYGQAVTALQTEEHPTNPNWEYGVSKLACEHYASIHCERRPELSVSSLRYAIVYGEHEWFGRVLTLFLRRALDGRPPVVFGSGEQIRDFVYVGDIVDLNRRCMESENPGHLVLNGSTAVGTSIVELARIVCEVTGLETDPLFEEVAQGQRSALVDGRMRLPSELAAMCMSYARAEAELGWRPAVALRDGLEREWKWLQDHAGRWTTMSY